MAQTVYLTDEGKNIIKEEKANYLKKNNLNNSDSLVDCCQEANLRDDSFKRLLGQKRPYYIKKTNFETILKLLGLEITKNFVEGTHFSYGKPNSVNGERSELIDEQHNRLNQLEKDLIEVLESDFSELSRKIYQTYYWSLSERTIKKTIEPEKTKSLNSLISNLNLPLGNNETYRCLHKFLGNLFYYQDLFEPLKGKLRMLIEKNNEDIKDHNNFQIKLEEDKNSREEQCNPGLFVIINEKYSVEGWLINNLEEYETIPFSEQNYNDYSKLKFKKSKEKKQTNNQLSNMSNLLEELIDSTFSQCKKEIKQIHIFLPYKLMNHNIDFWQVDNQKIVDKYQVVLRCSERLEGKNPKINSWLKKADTLKGQLKKLADENVLVLNESDNTTALRTELQISRDAIAMKITNVFTNEQPGELLYDHSIPIAVWIKKQLPNVDNKLELNNLIRKGNELNSEIICLRDLPEQVRLKRIEANGDNHVGSHICLLWDDPNLLPPKQRLTHQTLS